MSAGKSIFIDLEIDTELFDTPKEFAAQVFEAAAKLGEVLDHNTSLGTARENARKSAKANIEAKAAVSKLQEKNLSAILSDCEEMSLDELFYFIDDLKELTKQAELTFESRATGQMISQSPSAVDKRLAMEQYKNLRESWEDYRKFASLMLDDAGTLAPLKARSGNYGNGARQTYPAYKYKGGTYHNYVAVGRLIGCDKTLNNHMDLQDYLAITPDTGVEVVEITL